jgi:hypothetical protein
LLVTSREIARLGWEVTGVGRRIQCWASDRLCGIGLVVGPVMGRLLVGCFNAGVASSRWINLQDSFFAGLQYYTNRVPISLFLINRIFQEYYENQALQGHCSISDPQPLLLPWFLTDAPGQARLD